jgi:alkyl hydroperoxide reductase subunit AhpC
MKINVGDKAPDFTLPSQMDDNVTLSEYFGKKNIVFYFYTKDETRGCTRSLRVQRQLQRLHKLGRRSAENTQRTRKGVTPPFASLVQHSNPKDGTVQTAGRPEG